MLLISVAVFLISSILVYFRIARIYGIVDRPNHRSLHSISTIRGGGLVFYLALLIYFFYAKFSLPYFFIGLTFVSVISFLDDIFTLPNKYRFPIHIIGIILIFFELRLFSFVPYQWLFPILILNVGILNAYNFMDGINGITGGYSFVLIATLIYINTSVFEFINAEFLYFVLISLVIFNFLNFRKIAICFAGDIGSISMGFIVIFLLSKLILESGDYDYILLLALYGIDSISTLIIRLFNKENIFTAHKKHLYQMLIYNSGWSHLKVSISYMIIQGVINFAILTRVQYFKEYHLFGLVILGFVGGAYLIIRSKASNA